MDPNRIAVWGFFYSSAIAIEAAAFDKRLKAVISQGLMPEWYLHEDDHEELVARAVEDRANQLAGKPPGYIPLLNEKGEHALYFKYLVNMTPDQQAHLPNWVIGARKTAPNFRDSLTIQSFYRHAKWKPVNLFKSVSPTPVMIWRRRMTRLCRLSIRGAYLIVWTRRRRSSILSRIGAIRTF